MTDSRPCLTLVFMSVNPQTFCSLPFVHISNRTNGDIVPCCLVDEPIRSDDGTPLNVSRGDSFKDAFYSKDMASLRDNLKNGIKDPKCHRCWKMESTGASSKRISDGSRFNDIAKQRALKNRPEFQPVSWDLKLGTFCNLTCRMCDEESSSSILKEKVNRNLIDPKIASEVLRRTSDFTTSKTFREEIRSLAPCVQEIYFLGGEPTLMKGVLNLVDDVASFGNPEKTTLRWSTNLTHYNEALVASANMFKNVIVDCSIDGFGELNDYIRDQSKWSDIDLNAKRLRADLPDAHIKVVCTVSVFNVFSLRKLYDWSLDRGLDLAFNFLDSPAFLNAKILPESVKENILKSYADIDNFQFQELRHWLPGGSSDSQLKNFTDWNRNEDLLRKKTFSPSFTEIL